jgi:hypothetical protein
MRLPALFLGLASLLLVACARNTVDCAMGEARSDCAPGTAGAEKRALQEEAARTFETIDDTRCRSFTKLPRMPPQGRKRPTVLLARIPSSAFLLFAVLQRR